MDVLILMLAVGFLVMAFSGLIQSQRVAMLADRLDNLAERVDKMDMALARVSPREVHHIDRDIARLRTDFLALDERIKYLADKLE